jgi:hypothetical protein
MRKRVAEVERIMKAGRKLNKGTSLSLVVSEVAVSGDNTDKQIKILKFGM